MPFVKFLLAPSASGIEIFSITIEDDRDLETVAQTRRRLLILMFVLMIGFVVNDMTFR